MGMGGVSIWQLIIIVVYAAIVVIPLWKITAKAGFNGAWSLLMIIPLVNIIYLWVIAFIEWPNLLDRNRPSPGN